MAVVDEFLISPDTTGPRRWTLDEYVRLDEEGFLGTEGEHYELLNGEIIQKLGQNLPHIAGISLVSATLSTVFRESYLVAPQRPLHIGERHRLRQTEGSLIWQ